MSIIPLLRELDDSFSEFEELLEAPFGLGIHPVDIFRPRHHRSLVLRPRNRYYPYLIKYTRPRKESSHADKSDLVVPTVGKDGFQVCMDVSQFKPNELTVKTVDRMVVVEGKHEEREDEHGLIQRQFVRKYTLPKGYDPKDVVSTISSDGVLTVKAPPPAIKGKANNERIVQIQQTGPAHLNVKQPDELKKNVEACNGAAEKMDTK
ncbi:heat shock protein 27-like [Musca vetustissima]|uniref:heat shock protein 27-like n=1 Tax=Musca vetustissima TaxID=27455 RepID=UPI002AB6094F|nr:heat shock protein 27-like [Musca vetustissima]XP_061401121.1 heat shock protein 27-like [Musca vetustissima]